MKLWQNMKTLWQRFTRRLSPWMHLVVFMLILSVTTLLKYWAAMVDWIAPPLAAWELAALVHVFLVAQKLMQFRGFEFATKKFNSRVQRWVINVIIGFIFLKLIAIFFETQTHEAGIEVPALRLPEKAVVFNHAVHFIAPYIVMLPLFFFFAINCFARQHVIKQARALAINDTSQERYLAGLMKFVDAPVVLPFVVMVVYLKFVDRMFEKQTEDLVIGIIGCCLLIVSNLLTGVFDEHWSDVTKNRREHGSGLA
jgi:hypothetical protein